MSKNLITKIENMLVHDASSIHKVVPNASSYTVTYGDPEAVYHNTESIGIPTDLRDMLINLTPNLILRDTSDADISIYSKTECDGIFIKEPGNGQTGQILKLDDDLKPIWQDLVSYESVKIQLEVESGTGSVANIPITVQVEGENNPRSLVADSSGVANTSVGFGLQYIITFGTIEGYLPPSSLVYRASLLSRVVTCIYHEDTTVSQEHVTVWLYYTSGSSNRAADVKVTIGSVTTSYPTVTGTTYDTCEFYVDYGQTYTIVFEDVDTYATPHSQTFLSQFRARSAKSYYIGAITDIAWVKQSDGSTIPFNDITLATAHEYFGLRLSSSALASQNAAFIVPLEYMIMSNIVYTDSEGITYTTTARSLSTRQWATQNILFDDRPCYTSRAAAITNDGNANFDGENNTDVFIAEAARKTAAGTTVSVPAMTACRGVSYTVNEVVKYGFLGSLLQMETFAGKYNDLDILFSSLFGVHCIQVCSGCWWSSTQLSATTAWDLYNGSARGYYGNKYISYIVVPFFAI